jgi:transcriptional regulator with XRE-family HTH domain
LLYGWGMEDTLGSRLKLAREDQGLSQSELARRVGLSPQAIQYIESDKTVRTRYLNQIAGVLGVHPTWLESGRGERLRSEQFLVPKTVRIEKPDAGIGRANDLPFPEAALKYHQDTIPVFIGEAVAASYDKHEGDPQKQFNSLWLQENLRDNAEAVGSWTEGGFAYYVDWNFLHLTGGEPDDVIARPFYLKGQVEAYGLFLKTTPSISDRIHGHSILHVGPYKRPDYGDYVVVWMENNTFTVGLFTREDNHTIRLQEATLSDKHFKSGKAFDKSFNHDLITFSIPKYKTKALHVVLGLEFAIPRSSKVASEEIMHTRWLLAEDEIYKIE